MADLYENILNSISLVANSKTEELEYDKTVICIILEVVDKRKGKYTVSDSSSKFTAYAYDDSYYSVNDVVYVTIPNNDFDKQKWIVGVAASDDKEIYKPIEPEEGFSRITFEKDISEEYKLLANGEQDRIEIFSTNEKIDTKDEWYLCISGNFDVSVPGVENGNYGISFILNTNKEEAEWITYKLDCSEMTGPVYKQNALQAIYYIMEEFALDGYKIELYQEKNFTYKNNNLVSYEGMNNEDYFNIKVSDVKIYIGEVADIEKQFQKIHYSQIQNNSGLIIGKNQTKTGLFAYDNKKNIFAITSDGKSSIGFEKNGQIVAKETETKVNGNVKLKINDIFETDNEQLLHINNVTLTEQAIINSKKAFEDNIYKEFFEIKNKEASIAATKSLSYYIDFDAGDDGNSGFLTEPFKTIEPIKNYLKGNPTELKVYFLSSGEVSLEDLTSINDVKIKIYNQSDGEISFMLPNKDFYFNNSKIDFSGSTDAQFGFYGDKKLFIKNCNFNLTYTNFFTKIYIDSSYTVFKYCFYTPLSINNSNVYIDNSSVNALYIINSNVYLNSCNFIGSDEECEENNNPCHCYAFNSNVNIGGSSRIILYDGDRQRDYYWYTDGGSISFISSLIHDKSENAQYQTEGQISTKKPGSQYLKEFKVYAAQHNNWFGHGQCGEGVSAYSSWLGHGGIGGATAWQMYCGRSWASWATEVAVSDRQPGDIAFWSDGGAGHTAIIDNDVNFYYGQNQGGDGHGRAFNSISVGAPNKVIRPNEFGNASTFSITYISDKRKYKNFISCNGTALASTSTIMKSWCIFVDASSADCYKIEYNDYKVNEGSGDSDSAEILAQRDEVINQLKSDKAKEAFGTLNDKVIEACFRLCDWEGYGEDEVFASFMAATIVNRLIELHNQKGTFTADELYRYWGGGDGSYNEAYFNSQFAARKVRDWVYRSVSAAYVKIVIEKREDYKQAWSCHGVCPENGYGGGVQWSSETLINKDTGKKLFQHFSTGVWAGIWPKSAGWH